jgi:hypothetical protein
MKYDDCREYHPCEICGQRGDPHEIITRGSGGKREPDNVIYLCPTHHTLGPDAFHRVGRATFADSFPQFRERIEKACRLYGRKFDKRGK